MSISMIGIDHNMAPVDIRAKFAFTKKVPVKQWKNKESKWNIWMRDPVHL